MIKFFSDFGLYTLQISSIYHILYIVYFLREFFKPCVIHGLFRNSISFLLSFLIGACISSSPSISDRYWFIKKLTSLLSPHKICSFSAWSKSKRNLLLSNFLQPRLKILDFAADNFEEKSFKKWSAGDGWKWLKRGIF